MWTDIPRTFLINDAQIFPGASLEAMYLTAKMTDTQLCPSSFSLVRMMGDSMKAAQLPDKSILVIEPSLPVRPGSIVIATVNGERLVKYFVKTHAGIFLASSDGNHAPIRLTENMDVSIGGVVSHVIIQLAG